MAFCAPYDVCGYTATVSSITVSYTHLDVYKRQILYALMAWLFIFHVSGIPDTQVSAPKDELDKKKALLIPYTLAIPF